MVTPLKGCLIETRLYILVWSYMAQKVIKRVAKTCWDYPFESLKTSWFLKSSTIFWARLSQQLEIFGSQTDASRWMLVVSLEIRFAMPKSMTCESHSVSSWPNRGFSSKFQSQWKQANAFVHRFLDICGRSSNDPHTSSQWTVSSNPCQSHP